MVSLITGATGFVGCHLAEWLVEQGDDVVGLSHHGRWPTDAPEAIQRLPLFAVDVADGAALQRIMHQVRPDRIYHLAAQANVLESLRDPEATWKTNLLGARRLFDAALGLPETRILYVSTGNVYGQPPDAELPITEQTPPRPTTPYAQSKLAGEFLAKKYVEQLGVRLFVARPFNHAGPRQDGSYALSHFARQIAELERKGGEGVLVVGNLQVVRDFSDVRDVVRAYQAILEYASPGECYNVASGDSTLLKDALDALLQMTSCRVVVEQDPNLVRSNDLSRIEVDNRMLRERTGWSPRIPLSQTLEDTLNYWRNHYHETQ